MTKAHRESVFMILSSKLDQIEAAELEVDINNAVKNMFKDYLEQENRSIARAIKSCDKYKKDSFIKEFTEGCKSTYNIIMEGNNEKIKSL